MITKKIKNICIILISVVVMILYSTNVKYSTEIIINSVNFCINSLVTSLFPNLILAGIITGGISFEQQNAKNKRNILGNCKIYTIPILTGMLSGFISGPRAICSIYDKYKGDERDFTLAVSLSSNAGIGFVIACVGVRIWEDVSYGIVLYFSQIFSALLVYYFLKSQNKKDVCCYSFVEQKRKNILSSSIINAFNSICIICSFYIFFNFILELFRYTFNLNMVFNGVICSFFDFAGSVFKLSKFSNKYLAKFLTGFAVAFAGISVHLQTFFVCDGYPLKKYLFVFFKFLQGLICAFISLIYEIF